ncbi:methyltransferase domain-containing protein [Streptomyces sp. SID8375]|uniref:methyltransferase domain-containing protein n=1 Tax=unclassified Streptomyces TaxID=2593676 RepID=UPI000365179C|nr:MULTISPECIES: methyltransferase domain-containing protein [unclassified Streptomyces]MYX10284.1 methyltransferase domain-containing protein [Streptomyces sp. SID8375]
MSTDAPADPSPQPAPEPLNPPAGQGESPLPTADAAYWEAAAASFDDEPDHGLRDPAVRAAWAARLRTWLPSGPAAVLDLGCGTGSLSLLAAEQGHHVTGIDRSEGMIARARTKLAGREAAFLVGEAAEPPVGERRFDVVLVRHVLWALPDPAAALRRWAGLLTPGGRLVLVEGRWGEAGPVGLPAAELTALVAPLAARTQVESLAHDPALWGKEVADERYVLLADLPRRHTEVVDVHLVLRRGDEVLLARRANTGYADGLFHAPSGHAEDGEDVREAMIREAAEEVGLRLAPEDLRVALVMQHCAPPPARPRIGWFFEAAYGAGGEPWNREPDKCAELAWFPLDALPDDMVAYCRAGLDGLRAGHRFLLHRHRPGDAIAYDPVGPDRAVVLDGPGPTG